MRTRHLAILTILAIFTLFSCSEDKVINNYNGDSRYGSLSGIVAPIDNATVTLTGVEEYTTTINAIGGFILDSLIPGIYTLEIQPENYSKRLLPEVKVTAGSVNQLGHMELSNFPFPIYKVVPENGATDVSTRSGIMIYPDVKLDLESVIENATITPSLNGIWIEHPSTANSNMIVYNRYESLQVGQTYTLTIPAETKLENGQTLGSDLVTSFTVQPISVRGDVHDNGLEGKVELADPNITLHFTAEVNVDSLNQAVQIVPAVEGFWVDYSPSSNAVFKYFITQKSLSPNTDYTLTVMDSVNLGNGHMLYSPYAMTFTTESYGVQHINPSNGSVGFPRDSNIGISFNISMDSASTETAFSLTKLDSDPVEGEFAWASNYTQLTFNPDGNLDSLSVYQVTIDSTAMVKSMDGHIERYVSYFMTR
jgi:hypothetical protein